MLAVLLVGDRDVVSMVVSESKRWLRLNKSGRENAKAS